MTTIVNTPPSTDSSSGLGIVIGVIVAIVIIALFVIYGLPLLRTGATSSDTIDVNVQLTPAAAVPSDTTK